MAEEGAAIPSESPRKARPQRVVGPLRTLPIPPGTDTSDTTDTNPPHLLKSESKNVSVVSLPSETVTSVTEPPSLLKGGSSPVTVVTLPYDLSGISIVNATRLSCQSPEVTLVLSS